MTYPLIGNYGICEEDYECKIPSIGGLVVYDYNDSPSNFRCVKALSELLEEDNIPAISGVDTRKLARSIRNLGSRRVLITAGTAIRESMEILKHLEGTRVIATFIMVDRKEKGQGEKGAMQEIEEQFGFPVYSVVDVYDIIEYLEEDPANEENVTRIKNYLAVNGAKA